MQVVFFRLSNVSYDSVFRSSTNHSFPRNVAAGGASPVSITGQGCHRYEKTDQDVKVRFLVGQEDDE